jgi:flagellar assembly protein FliH
MSLSKVFKDSPLFQPEEILPRPASGKSSFAGIGRADQPFRESSLSGRKRPPQGFTPATRVSQPPLDSSPPEERTSPPADAHQEPLDSQPAQLDSPQEEKELEIQGIDPFTVEKMVEESFQRGVSEGLQRAEADFGSALQALLALCRQLDNLRETILANSIGEMQDLAIAIAEKIVRISVREQDSTIVETVEEAIHGAVRSDEFYVYVHPDDFAVVQEKSPDFIAGLNGLNNLVIKKDPAVERGGCKVESENCTVDATIVSQFEIIRERVKTRLIQA